ncbi:MAG TPA: transcriptional regulator NrdR [Chloroflexota bacterium]|nr:transcriptional regulator NrdR [Chloroflexota bacterium]HEX2987168.1 transcriptional regulator NrdR [Chloroflexota bacterium]
MKCPYCAHDQTKVVDKRDMTAGSTKRRRLCARCGRRFSTYEQAEAASLVVVKKDGRREPFDRGKLRAGLLKACEKRPISSETIESLLEEVETGCRCRDGMEVLSTVIGELVMDKLRSLDKIAYIRFASVYRAFADLQSFEEELHNLLKTR